MIQHYLTTAWRQLMKYKVQNLIALLGLGLALLCFSVCLHVSRYMFNVNKSIENRDRIARVNVKQIENDKVLRVTSGQLAAELRTKGLHNVDFCAVYNNDDREYNVVFSDNRLLPYKISGLETDSLFYKFFNPQILYGSWAATSRTPNAVVLTLQKAKQIFGNPAEAVGKHLISTHPFEGSSRKAPSTSGIMYTITAVMEDFPTNTTVHFMRTFDSLVLNDSEGVILNPLPMLGTQTFAMVGKGRNISDFISQLDRQQLIVEQLYDNYSVVAVPFEKDLSFNEFFLVLSISITVAGTLVLLAGLLNFFYFLIGSFLIRIREYNIRRAHGAGFSSLQLMLFTQSALYVALVGIVTFIAMEWLINGWQLDFPGVHFSFQMNILLQQTFSYLLALLFVCMAVAVVLIYKVRKINISIGLFGTLGGTSKHRLRTLMMGVQLVIAWIFLSLTVALFLQADHVSKAIFSSLSTEEKERTLSVSLDYCFLSDVQKEEIVSRIQHVSGVELLTRSEENIAGSGWWNTTFFKGEQTRDNAISLYFLRVDADFFDFFHIPLLSGSLSKESGQLMVDPVLAKRLGEKALGTQLFDYDRNSYIVTGVCEKPLFEMYNPGREALGELYWVYDFKGQFGHCYVKAAPGRTADVKQAVEAILRDILPENIEPEVSTFIETIEKVQALEFKLRDIIFFMAIVAMLISILGIYSSITLDTEHRQKEMAIRKINGAKMYHIVLIFARLYLKLLAVCALIAFPIVGLIISTVSSFYVSAVSFGFFFYLGVFLLVSVLVGMALYVRIRNIARINPSVIIKNE